MKKVDLSVLDISSAIISRVDSLHQSSNYLRFGIVMSVFLSFVPTLFRVVMVEGGNLNDTQSPSSDQSNPMSNQLDFLSQILGDNYWCWLLITLNGVNRLVLGSCFFFLLSVAERTFKQRFLYAKHFCYLTSARRARKYDLPHFRLNKVINIKSWLSIRSCLKKRGPQHSVDVIISATFIVTLLLVSYLGVEALKDEEKVSQPLHNCELFAW
ncbi:putative homeodomain transcription factor [Armadillidium nasatum]|uniref:Putative homeodomain transcription factor n=1 Tax=Armadillidium nasatum TaxID=96803 RepID=A0A5N5TKH7_9CRUS|nr:putative homeodomain transcription factor [Armadillidium nasatum]